MAFGMYAALPPEVNVGRLLAGAGPLPMFAVAAGYTAIAQAAQTLASAMDAQVQSLMTTWQGDAADQAMPAFQAHSGWLRELAAVAQTTAAQASAVATSYVTALATSPTLAELAVNRTTLVTLIATNILGINTVPIGVTEADYMRMWGQAAGAMSTYDAEATANSVMTAPQQAPAIVSQLIGQLSSLTGQLSSLASTAQQDNQSDGDERSEGDELLNTHPNSELTAGFLGTTHGSTVLNALRSGSGSVPEPILTRGLDEMPGENTGFLVPASWVPGAVAGEPAGTRPGALATNAAGTAPLGGAPLAAAPLGAIAPAAAGRPVSMETVSVPGRQEVPTSTAVAVIDVTDDEEVSASVET